MLRFGTTFFCLWVLTLVAAYATDYRLVVASDDPATRQAPALVVFEGSGKLTPEDRITSITFAAGIDQKSNCLVSLDGAAGKANLGLSPDVEVYKGKVMIAGAKPTRKVIPGYLAVDTPVSAAKGGGKLSQLVQPIIHQVYNLPWGYIGVGVFIVLVGIFLMNRRSQAYTTSMTREAKSLYLETVKSIMDRLDKIESSQHNLVKNPPVARAFRNQIEGFENRLLKIEKLSSSLSEELGKGGERHKELTSKLDTVREESFQRSVVQQEAVQALKADLEQLAKVQGAVRQELGALAELQAAARSAAEQLGSLEARLKEASSTASEDVAKSMAQIQALQAQVQALQAAFASQIEAVQASLSSQVESLQAGFASLPQEFEAVRASMPSLEGVEVRLEKLEAPLEKVGSNLEEVHESIRRQIGELSGQLDENRESLGELLAAHQFVAPVEEPVAEIVEEDLEVVKDLEVLEVPEEEPVFELIAPEEIQEPEVEEPVAEVQVEEEPELDFEAIPEPEPEPLVVPEFSFSREVARLVSEPVPSPVEEEREEEPKVIFHLDALPDHLETFEDAEPDETLTVFQQADLTEEEASDDVVAEVLNGLMSSQAEEEPTSEEEEEPTSQSGQWLGLGGNPARTWSSASSRPFELTKFENELKPLTPIGTAPIGNTIGAALYSYGRVVYACGNAIYGFWPGRDDRQITLDHPMPEGDWRLAAKGQNLFIAEKNRVKIVSLQGWFTLEQFSGEYLDQMVADHRWVGLRESDGAVLDYRDHRGQMVVDGLHMDMKVQGFQLCSSGKQVFAGSKAGRIVEVSEHGVDEIGQGPAGADLLHLCVYQGAPLALFGDGKSMELWHFGSSVRTCPLDLSGYQAAPVLIGSKLYLADVENCALWQVNLKKMQPSSVSAFEGVTGLRRMIGLEHRSNHSLFAITCDGGRAAGRLVLLDLKSGGATKLCSVGQGHADLICADYHLVLATSCEYQNVIRVMEPFVQRLAA